MAAPSLPAEIRKLLARQQFVAGSSVESYRLLDILATPEADIGDLIVKFREMKEPAMRKAFHDVAVLLKEMEKSYLKETATQSGDEPPKPAKTKISQSPDLVSNLQALQAEEHVLVYSDGASKGNPGDSGIAYVIADRRATSLLEHCGYIGHATNNEAEYQALLAAMQKVVEMGKRRASFFSDSELVVNQVLGRWKVNKAELLPYVEQIRQLKRSFEKFELSAIPREQNKRADFLATCAIKAARAKTAEAEGGAEA